MLNILVQNYTLVEAQVCTDFVIQDSHIVCKGDLFGTTAYIWHTEAEIHILILFSFSFLTPNAYWCIRRRCIIAKLKKLQKCKRGTFGKNERLHTLAIALTWWSSGVRFVQRFCRIPTTHHRFLTIWRTKIFTTLDLGRTYEDEVLFSLGLAEKLAEDPLEGSSEFSRN